MPDARDRSGPGPAAANTETPVAGCCGRPDDAIWFRSVCGSGPSWFDLVRFVARLSTGGAGAGGARKGGSAGSFGAREFALSCLSTGMLWYATSSSFVHPSASRGRKITTGNEGAPRIQNYDDERHFQKKKKKTSILGTKSRAAATLESVGSRAFSSHLLEDGFHFHQLHDLRCIRRCYRSYLTTKSDADSVGKVKRSKRPWR